ncbi:hypothetical protein BCF74_11425 [Knoellia remsis]|uniref:Uncharacterized protein n=1 Tax=Knoellia remsis TaxID=407159 RepID=A0A2T0UJ80_9MICO|nr:hypothetical protein BCF74_11425 [Knoellia remsis]
MAGAWLAWRRRWYETTGWAVGVEPIWRRWSGRVLVALLLASILLSLPYDCRDHLLVLGGIVVRSSVLAGGALVLAAALGVARAVVSEPIRRSPIALRQKRCARRMATLVVAVGSCFLTVLGALDDLVMTYVVLEPASPQGCRVVVVERSFLLLGSGDIHLLPSGRVVTNVVDGYQAEDGQQPFSRGRYSLVWTGERGLLTAPGTSDAPVTPSTFTVDCG